MYGGKGDNKSMRGQFRGHWDQHCRQDRGGGTEADEPKLIFNVTRGSFDLEKETYHVPSVAGPRSDVAGESRRRPLYECDF